MSCFLRYFLYFVILTTYFGCKNPYLPPLINSPRSFLVVEGVISGGTVPTTIKISQTVNLSNIKIANPVSKAIVTIEDDQSGVYQLPETSRGTYTLSALNLDNTRKYRLRIKTAGGKQYVSDFVTVVSSPPIDSVGYQAATNGLNIYLNTHDPKNGTRYYRWDYQETWIIHSNYDSYFKSNGDTVLARDLINDNVYQCWRSDTSNVIILNSSAKLLNDIISDNPVTFIPSTSEKLGIKYSIIIDQYALTSDAYAFWTNLKKNTEQLGSIFDAQPSTVNGNIHCLSDPLEPVIGYISAGNVSSRRIFITSAQLPNWVPVRAYPDCTLDSAYYAYYPQGSKTPVNQVNQFINYHKGANSPLTPVDAIQPPGAPKPIGYSASGPECVDCTLRGTNKQPAFWR